MIELSSHNSTESTDIFLPIDGGSGGSSSGGPPVNGNIHNFLKRRTSENFIDTPNGPPEWSDLLPSKRPAYHSMLLGAASHLYPPHSQFLDYQNGPHTQNESTPFVNPEKVTI